MSDLEEHIKRVNAKVQHLLKQWQLSQKVNTQLANEVKSLKETHENDLIRIAQ